LKKHGIFESCCPEELTDLVDACEPVEFAANSIVIKQGDIGDEFYIVESGSLDIYFDENGTDVKYGLPYVQGSIFGELACVYDVKRQATIKAYEQCKLWKMEQKIFRSIMIHHKKMIKENCVAVLNKVVIKNHMLKDLVKQHHIELLSELFFTETFEKDEVIIREGEVSDVFYIIESGTVEMFTKAEGTNPVGTLSSSEYIGHMEVRTSKKRQATYKAASQVRCFYLFGDGFNSIMKVIDEIIEKKETRSEQTDGTITNSVAIRKSKAWELKDFSLGDTIGEGAFGSVKVVTAKKTGTLFALKIQSKSIMADETIKEMVLREISIHNSLEYSFICNMHSTFQDDKNMYYLLDYLPGGTLFDLMENNPFPEKSARFYAASVALVISYLHDKSIAYRDLKPENICLDAKGYAHMIDFGFARKIEEHSYTFCGTPEYLAPEIVLCEGHGLGVDNWALGILIFEMIEGKTPFYSEVNMDMFKKSILGDFVMPQKFSQPVSDLIKKLLNVKAIKRLGAIDSARIGRHKWFSGFDWDSLLKKEIEVPFVPN